MRPNMKKLSTFSVIALATILSGAIQNADRCSPDSPAFCLPDPCEQCYCLGPENFLANAPTSPFTCNGDLTVTAALIAWQADQDGLEYALNTQVFGDDAASSNPDLNNIIDATYLKPQGNWDLGFKLGISYTSFCDGWDIGILWTFFQSNTKHHEEAEQTDNHTLLPLWSAFQFPSGANAPILFSTDIETKWHTNLNLIDLELGRQFWVSRYLSIRPHVGLRYAAILQDFDIFHKGGSWNDPASSDKKNFVDEVDLDNNFTGLGIRGGVGTNWNLGCGWALFGDVGLSILYGRFDVSHFEMIREAVSPFTKFRILETHDRFRASRAIADLSLGIQWSALVCDCKYGFLVGLGWDQQILFHQNQLWRVMRHGGWNQATIFNNTGENVHQQRRGNFSTHGITLKGKFLF